MAVTKTRAGTNPDGTPHWSYVTDTDDPHLVVTGPAAGIVKAADGTEYTVDEDVIEVASLAHAQEVAHQIGQQHMRRGTFGDGWVHRYDPEVAARFASHEPMGEPHQPHPEGYDAEAKPPASPTAVTVPAAALQSSPPPPSGGVPVPPPTGA